jgi:acetyl-CoA acetyltransferase
MPAAPVPAAQMALDVAGLKITDIKAIKTHNPFATNDLNLAKRMGTNVMKMNNYGSSLITVIHRDQLPAGGSLK